ncbi:hypothetical protein GUJ93_ZPchr0010g9377 [Zizania palustris]|uniref:Uncharacterized protein n=1 Tax=Zizania palustris TaxID=103762 RepID=A0A8J6BD37_ZIZPA|nr:hypothetical protein GUJ93_ZPchr0010g9377 [Zizania palustris]
MRNPSMKATFTLFNSTAKTSQVLVPIRRRLQRRPAAVRSADPPPSAALAHASAAVCLTGSCFCRGSRDVYCFPSISRRRSAGLPGRAPSATAPFAPPLRCPEAVHRPCRWRPFFHLCGRPIEKAGMWLVLERGPHS